jgi:hypothetical protein
VSGFSRTVIAVGAVASITGAAILVYANRPECATNQLAGGCGYGTKVHAVRNRRRRDHRPVCVSMTAS